MTQCIKDPALSLLGQGCGSGVGWIPGQELPQVMGLRGGRGGRRETLSVCLSHSQLINLINQISAAQIMRYLKLNPLRFINFI